VVNTDLKPGDELDGFRIVQLLGQGASSEVVLATDGDGRRVVLKLPRDAALASPSSFDRFRRELEIVRRLDHPGIQRSTDDHLDRSRPYLIVEYVDGGTLAGLLGREGPLPVDRAIDFACQLTRAMAHAHRQGVVHRDLKPLNVLVAAGDRLVITDFGIGLLDGAKRLTWQWFGAALGTPDYMSPEQVQGRRGDARSDQSLRMTRQGLPTATTRGGMSRVTTLPAPITDSAPIVTPGRTMTPPPSQTSSPIVIGLADSSGRGPCEWRRRAGGRRCRAGARARSRCARRSSPACCRG
jgi:serine/threonine protein kinase